jgi:hypothetical protein
MNAFSSSRPWVKIKTISPPSMKQKWGCSKIHVTINLQKINGEIHLEYLKLIQLHDEIDSEQQGFP